MRIKSFGIDSYRSCLKTKLTIRDELTGLIGVNGAGKSNILNALVLLKKAFRTRPSTRSADTPSPNKCHISTEIEYQNKSVFISGNIGYETDEHNSDDVVSSKMKFNFREFVDYSGWINIPHYLLPESFHPLWTREGDKYFIPRNQLGLLEPNLFKNDSPFKYIFESKDLCSFLPQLANFLKGMNLYSASQFSDPGRCPVAFDIEENRPLRTYPWRSGSVAHEQFILDLYKLYKSYKKPTKTGDDIPYKRFINTVNRDGIGLIDSADFDEIEMPSNYVEVKIGGKIKPIERTRHLMVPRFTINNVTLSPNQLSEGTFKTLALIFYILTDDSKLMLIEEPEVCVHHGLLNSVISLIKIQSKQKQIIISTHSDFVLDHLDPDDIQLVRRLPQRGTVSTALNKTLSKNDYRALRSYLQESGNLGEYWKGSGFIND